MRAAIVDANNIVRNIIEWKAESDYKAPPGMSIIADASNVEIGSILEGDKFIPPAPKPPAPTPPEAVEIRAIMFVAQTVVSDQLKADTFNFDQTEAVLPLFPEWAVGLDVSVGEVYNYNGDLVEVIQAHTTQSDWSPDVTPALWKVYRAPNEVSVWVQPEGAHDAYNAGDKVTHNGVAYTSNVDGNVWEPPTQWTAV